MVLRELGFAVEGKILFAAASKVARTVLAEEVAPVEVEIDNNQCPGPEGAAGFD